MCTPWITPRVGGSDPAPSPAPGCLRVLPAFCLGVVAVVAFQLAWGGLTLTSFFLKLFLYASFALLCFLAGSLVLLIRRSPLKVSRFGGGRRLTLDQLDFVSKLMVSAAALTHTHTHLDLVLLWDQSATCRLFVACSGPLRGDGSGAGPEQESGGLPQRGQSSERRCLPLFVCLFVCFLVNVVSRQTSQVCRHECCWWWVLFLDLSLRHVPLSATVSMVTNTTGSS